MDGFEKKLELLRLAFGKTPGLTVHQLAARAAVSMTLLAPGYIGPRTDKVRRSIAKAAAELLPGGYFDAQALETWLMQGEDVLCLEDYLCHLASQMACTRCEAWFTEGDEDYIVPLRRCRACVRAVQNPGTARYPEELRRRLPEIRAVAPKVAQGVERQLDQPQEAVTYERIGQRIGWTAGEVAKVLKGLGLDKRKLSVGVLLAAMLLSSGLSLAQSQEALCAPRRCRRAARPNFSRRNRNFRHRTRRASSRGLLLRCPGIRVPAEHSAAAGVLS